MSKLVIATKNAGKVKEIKAIFSGLFDDILSLRDAGIDADVVEDGDTFLANAAKKATEISLLTDCPVLADDSGICVDCLGGAPGVYSARYSEEGTDEANNRKIVEETRRFAPEQRTCHYACALVLAKGGDVLYSCEGECSGILLDEERGEGGFGYDPILMLPEYGKTSAEITMEEKNAISHRGKALRAMKELLEKDIDSLILGCTHYPLIRSLMRKIVGDKVQLVNPAYETALELKKLLADLDLASDEAAQEEFPYRFYVSDLAEKFKDFANSILSYNVEKTQKIDIEKY